MSTKAPKQPPKLADKCLKWFCRADLLEEIQGDLHEYYRIETDGMPRWRADILYWYHILNFLRPFALKRGRRQINFISMYRNYFKFAWRSIRLDAFFSSINIIGLGLGLAACLIIIQYLSREWNYDKFHENYDQIFRITQATEREGIRVESAATFSGLAPTLREQYPSVTASCRLHRLTGGATVEYGEKRFREEAIMGVDSSFFSIFSFPFLYGNPQTALDRANSIVITEGMAKKYFGDTDPLGQELIIDGAYGFWTASGYRDRHTYTVSGVINDLPELSHLTFDFLISLQLYSNLEQELKNWGESFYTYFKTTEESQLGVIEADLASLAEAFRPDQDVELHIQPMQAIHLTSDLVNEIRPNGNEQLTYLLALVGFIIILIAGTNYINFSTAKAINRQEDLEVRKIFGAKPAQLFQQLLTESFLLNALGLGFGLGLIYLNREILADVLGFHPTAPYRKVSFWWTAAVLLFAGTLISGIIPAFRYSRQQLVRLTGHKNFGRSTPQRSRRLLIIFQFSLSMIVIGCAVIMFRQMDFIRHKDLGIELDKTLVLSGPTIGQDNDSLYLQRMNSFREEAARMSSVREVVMANFIPGKEIRGDARGYVRRLGTPEALAQTYSFTKVGFDFMPVFDITLLAGRFFDPTFAGDLSFGQSVILNETACRQLGFASAREAIGQQINYRINSTPTIVGVVEDFHQYSLQRNFQPIIFEPTLIPQSYYYLKLSDAENADINALEGLWEDQFAGNVFQYFFLDDFYNAQYQRDDRFLGSFALFAVLAIFIAAIGFFGLIYYSASRRMKEIGIRRTFGAGFADVFGLLAGGLGLMLLFSAILSIPAIYLLADEWLARYAFRTDISWWMLLLPVLFLGLITLVVILVHSIRSYRVSPVSVIRDE